MNANLVNIVKQITAQYGEAILSDPARLKPLFSNLAKDEPKPLRSAFGRGLEAGAYSALKTAPDAAERASRKASIAQRVRDEHGLDPAFCAEALDILEAALFGTPQAAYTPPPYQQPRSYQNQPSYPPPNRAAPPQSVPFQTSGGNTLPGPAAKNNTIRNLLIAAAVSAAMVITVVIVRRVPPSDAELKNTALEIAAPLNSDAFEGFDPDKAITHYYFIPVTSDEAWGVSFIIRLAGGETSYITAHDTDSGLVKARNAGYNADYGVILYREHNQKNGKIQIAPARAAAK